MKTYTAKGFYIINGTEVIDLSSLNNSRQMSVPDSMQVEHFKNRNKLLAAYPEADIGGVRREHDNREAHRKKRIDEGHENVRPARSFQEFKDFRNAQKIMREARKKFRDG